MIGRIVEISNNNRYLSVYRGFLLVKSLGEEASELGRIPLDDILAVITNAHGLSFSNNLLVSLLERDIPLVITSDKYVPMGILWPVESPHLQAKRMDAQIGASLPLKKIAMGSSCSRKNSSTISVASSSGIAFFSIRQTGQRSKKWRPRQQRSNCGADLLDFGFR